MKSYHLDKMIKGWFVGGFEPCAFSTSDCEVAVKRYKAGDIEEAHYHKVATEVTLIVEGVAKMAGQTWKDGDIVTLAPGDVTDFQAITDVTTVVVKVPSATNDKYLV